MQNFKSLWQYFYMKYIGILLNLESPSFAVRPMSNKIDSIPIPILIEEERSYNIVWFYNILMTN